MPLGTATGLNYQYPFLGQPQQAGQQGGVPQQPAPQMGLGGDLSGLQYVGEGGLDKIDGDTSAVYDKYHKLKEQLPTKTNPRDSGECERETGALF